MTPLRRLSAKEVASAKSEGAAAQPVFESTLAELQQLAASVDGVELMARMAFSLQARLNSGAEAQGRPGVEVFHIELLHALFLASPRAIDSQAIDYSEVTQRAINLITRHATAFLDRSSGRASADPAEDAKLALMDQVQRWTLAVRGPRHLHQTLGFLNELSPATEVAFRRRFGCSLAELVAMVEGIYDLVSSRLTADLAWRRTWMWNRRSVAGMVEAFCAPLSCVFAEEIRASVLRPGLSRRDVFGRLFNAAEQRLAGHYTFKFEDIAPRFQPGDQASLRALLDRLAYGFVDLADVTPERLHLNNPVRFRPFVRLDDRRYFWPSSVSTGTGLVELVEDLVNTDETLKKRWERAKADWLEAKLKRAVSAGLPHADVRSKVKWTDQDGKEWESDLVAVLDKTVLVFEAKSGRITPPARRGAPDRLKDDLKKLIVDGSEQSERFRDRVLGADVPVTFSSAEGPLSLDPLEIRDITRATVVFDSLGSLSAHWPQLVAAGFLPADVDIAPTMSIFELETVFEVLTLDVERCHYLQRRAEFERNAQYTADELDLLAFYLDCQFNVGEAEFDGTPLPLYGASLKLAAGYSERRAAGTLSFPIKRTELWTRLLAAVEQSRPVGWTRFGYRLLCADLNQQRAFERLVRNGWRQVGRSPSHMFTTGITFGATKRLHTIAFAIGASDPPEQLRQNISHAAQAAGRDGGQDNILLIYWFWPKTGQAYDFIGVMRTARSMGLWSPTGGYTENRQL